MTILFKGSDNQEAVFSDLTEMAKGLKKLYKISKNDYFIITNKGTEWEEVKSVINSEILGKCKYL